MNHLFERFKLMRSALLKAAFLDDYIDGAIRYNLFKQQLLSSMMHSGEIGVSTCHTSENEIVVSLTTHGSRIQTVCFAVESVFFQTNKPDRVVLYLNRDEFSSADLPLLLRRQMDRGLEIRYVKDIGPHTKLLPALKEFPEAVIITVDDDYMYPFDMVERLVASHRKYPAAVCCNHSRELKFDTPSKLAAYDTFPMCFPKENTLSLNLLAEGFGGILYPPHSLSDTVFDERLIAELSPHADDLWFKAMELLNGTPVVQLARNRYWFRTMLSEECVQESGLKNYNNGKKGNDIQLQALFSFFDLFRTIQ